MRAFALGADRPPPPLPLLLCLALTAPALASAPAPTANGTDAHDGATCTDPETNVTAAEGEFLPLADGSCGRLWCEGGARRPRFVKHVCEKVPDSSCRVGPGVEDAPYPACCDRITCAGHQVQHGKCVDPVTKAVRERGSTWSLPDGECGFVECTGYLFHPRTRRFTWSWRKHSCAKQEATKPGCSYLDGEQGAVFPACCPRVMCRSRKLNSEPSEGSGDGDG